MELSKAVASTALILALLLVVGYARSDEPASASPAETAQKKLEKREEARRAALIEHQRRAEAFDRLCRKPVKTPEELSFCRSVYRQM